MIYKIVSTFFLGFILLVSSLYFATPEVFALDSVFYDRFYSGIKLTTRLENREIAQFPKTIGDLVLHGPTERGIGGEGISIDRECRFSDPEICSKMYRLQYRDASGNAYFVNISKFKEGKNASDVHGYISSFANSIEDDFFRFEKHEIAWISEARSAFIIIQQGVCKTTSDQTDSCNYQHRVEVDNEVVTSFIAQFPPSIRGE